MKFPFPFFSTFVWFNIFYIEFHFIFKFLKNFNFIRVGGKKKYKKFSVFRDFKILYCFYFILWNILLFFVFPFLAFPLFLFFFFLRKEIFICKSLVFILLFLKNIRSFIYDSSSFRNVYSLQIYVLFFFIIVWTIFYVWHSPPPFFIFFL